MRIFIGISGASGVVLGFKLLGILSQKAEVFAVISSGAKLALELENGIKADDFIKFCFQNGSTFKGFKSDKKPIKNIKNFIKTDDINYQNITFFDDKNLGASISSGSFGIDKSIISPCSINTLAKISNGISDTLITRAAAVALKEQKRLILGVREMPFSAISLRQMSDLASLGVAIAPPVFGFYSKAKSIEQMSDFIVGKWLDLLEIEHKIYKKWE